MSNPLPRRNPLPQLTPANVRRLQSIVAKKVWSKVTDLEVWRTDEQELGIDYQQAVSLPLKRLAPGEHFGRGGDQWTAFWMKIAIPPAANELSAHRYLRWNCQGETTVWIDGQPWAGLDLGHRECPLPDHSFDCWLQCCAWQTGVWISMLGQQGVSPHGLLFDGAEIATRDDIAWECHCDLDAIVQVMDQALAAEEDLNLVPAMGYCRAIESASPRLRRMLHDLEQLCDFWHATHDLRALQSECRNLMRRWPAESWQPTAAVCGHAHIDLVWLWPESATRKKIVHTLATVLRLLEDYPEMTFIQSMPAVYRMVEEECPQILPRIAEHIATGRWEALGGFEVEPDTNLPSGEGLLRSIILGQQKLSELVGAPSTVAWIPDVFGYSRCLPQILAEAGIKYFFTTKLTWSKITKFPYTSFVWRGADGTEVLAHLGTTDYNGEALLAAHDRAFAEHRQAGVHPELLLPTGYGDGGGGPTELQAERVRRFSDLSGAPRTRWTRVDEFFERLEQVRDQLPFYQGELYLEYHRGTYTTQSETKRLYRAAEVALQTHEAVRSARGMEALPENHWLRLLWTQFHDALPGSSIGEVYGKLRSELEEIVDRERQLALEVLQAPERAHSADSTQPRVFNPLAVAHVANIDSNGVLRQVRLPAVGSAPVESGEPVLHPIQRATTETLAHDRLKASFDQHGQLVELVVDGQTLELDGRPCLALSPDDPAAFDAWDIDQHAVKMATRVAEDVELQVEQHAPERAVLASRPIPLGQHSEMTIRYILEAASIYLKVQLDVHWQESHQLLRYVVPTRYYGRNALFGCPFGAIERPQLPGAEAAEAMWEVPASRWAGVQHDSRQGGLAIVAESKLGYAARDGVLSVSLLRAPKWPDENADLGAHVIEFALGPLRHETNQQGLSTSMAADALFTPAAAVLWSTGAFPVFLGKTGQFERVVVRTKCFDRGGLLHSTSRNGRSAGLRRVAPLRSASARRVG